VENQSTFSTKPWGDSGAKPYSNRHSHEIEEDKSKNSPAPLKISAVGEVGKPMIRQNWLRF
jgi:hypothetical protein